jgi:hypothetical protein
VKDTPLKDPRGNATRSAAHTLDERPLPSRVENAAALVAALLAGASLRRKPWRIVGRRANVILVRHDDGRDYAVTVESTDW